MSISTEAQAALDTVRSHRPEVGDYEAEFDAALDVLARELERLAGELHKFHNARRKADYVADAIIRAGSAEAERDAERARADRLEDNVRACGERSRNLAEKLGVVEIERDVARARADRLAADLEAVRRWFRERPWHGNPESASFGGRPYTDYERLVLGYGTYRDPRFLPDALAEHGSPEEARP